MARGSTDRADANRSESETGGEAVSRRWLIRGLAAATASTAGVLALSTDPAEAGVDGDVVLGGFNTATTQTTVNNTSTSFGAIAIAAGITDPGSASDSTALRAENDGDGFGVVGLAKATAIYGQANATGSGCGVAGDGPTGVRGSSTASGVDVDCAGTGRLHQKLFGATPPASGSVAVGEMIRTDDGSMYICTSSAPLTWRRVTTQHPSYAHAGGSVNLFAKAIRLLDTRNTSAPLNTGGAKLAAGTVHTFQITGTSVGGVSIPAGASGIVGTITAVGVTGSGSLKLYPGSEPVGSVISYGSYLGSTQLSAGFTVGIDASGKVHLKCLSHATHTILDITGFLY